MRSPATATQNSPHREMADNQGPRVPLIMVGGFLGAGKTTLVNRLLHNRTGQRVVVFVNDFGAVNIDRDLIKTVEQDRIALSNGCVCCSLNDDLVKSIADYARCDADIDAFVLESSGVSNPRQLNASLATLELTNLTRLDATLYIIDTDVYPQLDFVQREQIIDDATAADVIVMNKVDLAEACTVSELHALLKECAPWSARVESSHCDVPLDVLLGESATTRRSVPDFGHLLSAQQAKVFRTPASSPARLRDFSRNREYEGERTHERKHEHEHEHEYECEKALDHDHQFVSTSVSLNAPVDKRQFDRFCTTLPGKCLRAKGFLRFRQTPERVFVFNFVGARATLEALSDTDQPPECRLLMIGYANEKASLDAFAQEWQKPG